MLRAVGVVSIGFAAFFPTFAWGADTVGVNEMPPPGASAVPDSLAGFSLDTPIERLAANPQAAAIVDKYMPSLLENPRYPLFKSLSLKTVAAMSGGRISAESLNQVDAQLKAMPVTSAAR
jgi:hypothetical protein